MSEELAVKELRGLAERAAEEAASRARAVALLGATVAIDGLTDEEWFALHDRFCPLMPRCVEEGIGHGPEEKLRIIVRALKWAAAKVREE